MEKKKKVALVLAGGGSLGSYQVGAIEALEELGYEFDIVTGTSIGAINACFVCNHRTKDLRGLWEGIAPDQIMKDGINLSGRQMMAQHPDNFFKDFRKWSRIYLQGGRIGADISPLRNFINKHLDPQTCLDSDMEFGVVTSLFPSQRLRDVDMHKVTKQDFVSYILASAACFPIFPVQEIHGIKYIDGFYNDNLPIRLAFKLGADEVIAIDMRLFSLKPQNEFYLKLPNVTYIAPYVDFGSLMDFSQEVIRKNMKLGYLDTMKYFKKYRGFTFTFKDEINVEGFLSYILSTYGTDSKYIFEAITKGIRTPMDETDYFIRTLELIALRLGIEDYYELYSFKKFVLKIKDKSMLVNNTAFFTSMNIKNVFKHLRKNIELHRQDKVLNRFLRDFTNKYLSFDVSENQFLEYEETKYLHYIDKK